MYLPFPVKIFFFAISFSWTFSATSGQWSHRQSIISYHTISHYTRRWRTFYRPWSSSDCTNNRQKIYSSRNWQVESTNLRWICKSLQPFSAASSPQKNIDSFLRGTGVVHRLKVSVCGMISKYCGQMFIQATSKFDSACVSDPIVNRFLYFTYIVDNRAH